MALETPSVTVNNRGCGCVTIIVALIVVFTAWQLTHYYLDKQIELKKIELQMMQYSASTNCR